MAYNGDEAAAGAAGSDDEFADRPWPCVPLAVQKKPKGSDAAGGAGECGNDHVW